MIVKWGEFSSALDIVRHNTGMTEKTAGSRFRCIGALARIDVIGTSYVNHYMENSRHPGIPDRYEGGRALTGERIRKVTGETQQ